MVQVISIIITNHLDQVISIIVTNNGPGDCNYYY